MSKRTQNSFSVGKNSNLIIAVQMSKNQINLCAHKMRIYTAQNVEITN